MFLLVDFVQHTQLFHATVEKVKSLENQLSLGETKQGQGKLVDPNVLSSEMLSKTHMCDTAIRVGGILIVKISENSCGVKFKISSKHGKMIHYCGGNLM